MLCELDKAQTCIRKTESYIRGNQQIPLHVREELQKILILESGIYEWN